MRRGVWAKRTMTAPALQVPYLKVSFLPEDHHHVGRAAGDHYRQHIDGGENSSAQNHPETRLHKPVVGREKRIAHAARQESQEQGMQAPDPELAICRETRFHVFEARTLCRENRTG